MSTCLTSCLLHPQVHDALSTPGIFVACRTLLGRSFPYASEWSASFLFSLALRVAPAMLQIQAPVLSRASLSRLYSLVFAPSALSLFLRPIANLFRELDEVPGYFPGTAWLWSAWDSFFGVIPASNSWRLQCPILFSSAGVHPGLLPRFLRFFGLEFSVFVRFLSLLPGGCIGDHPNFSESIQSTYAKDWSRLFIPVQKK